MNWNILFAGIGAAATLLGANAWLMKIVISSEINKVLLDLHKEYITREEFDRHVKGCPHTAQVRG